MTSRLDANLTRHRRSCRSDDCDLCSYRDAPDRPSDADEDAWSGRYEDAYGPHGRWVS